MYVCNNNLKKKRIHGFEREQGRFYGQISKEKSEGECAIIIISNRKIKRKYHCLHHQSIAVMRHDVITTLIKKHFFGLPYSFRVLVHYPHGQKNNGRKGRHDIGGVAESDI